jgi:hypothetical protein
MKKLKSQIVFLLFLFPLLASSQTYLGIKAGLLATQIYSADETARETNRTDFQASYTLGLTYHQKASDVFSIGINLNYDHYNLYHYYSFSGAAGGYQGVDGTFTAGFMALYFYPQFNFGNRVQFYFNVGPYIAVLAHSNLNGSFRKMDGTIVTIADGSGTDYLANVRLAIKQTLGVSYNFYKRWEVFLETEFGRGTSVLSGNDSQFDVKVNTGVIFKVNDNRIKPPKQAARRSSTGN